MQKYNGIKQIAEKEKVLQMRNEERAKRTFTDAGINIMTVDGVRKIT